MKNSLLLFCMLLCLFLNAQTKQLKMDANTIVKDSAGAVYQYAIWTHLLSTNEYSLKFINRNHPEEGFIIYKLSEDEKNKKNAAAEARAAKAPKPNESKFFTTGQTISSFSAKDMEGNKYVLKDLKGKVVVLNFWFVNCGPCRMEMPQLNKIVDQYKDNPNIVFLASALDEKYEIEELMKQIPFKYHIIDGGRYIAQGKYGINLYPTHVILDKDGVVTFHTSGVGPGTIHWIQKTIDTLLTAN